MKLKNVLKLILVVLLTCSQTLFAQSNLQNFKIFGLTKGVNQKLNAFLIDDQELQSAQNIYFDEGSILKRLGYTKLNAAAIANAPDITGLYDYALANGTRKLICATSNGKIYKMDDLDGTWDEITSKQMTAITISFADTNPDTILDSANGFVTAGFQAGDSIVITGSTSNNGTYTIAAGGVAAGTLTLVAGDVLAAEAAGATVRVEGPDFTSNKRWTFSTFISTAGTIYCVMMNGTDQPQYWNGTASVVANLLDLGTGPTDLAPINHYQTVYKNRLWAAGNTTNPHRLYCSEVVEADDWLNGETFEIGDDGEAITGLAATKYAGADVYDKLIVFKTKSIWLVDATDTDPLNWFIVKINDTVGCASHWSIQNVADRLLFLNYDGIYALDGVVATQISDRIDPIIRALNSARMDDAVSVVNKDYDHYLLAVSNGSATENDTIIVYDYLLDAWLGTWDGMDVNAFTEVITPTTNQRRIYHGDYTGFVFRDYIGNVDNGVAIDAYAVTKKYTFDVAWMKMIRYLYMLAYASGNYNLNLGYRIDAQSGYTTTGLSLYASGSLWGTFVWGTDLWGGETMVRDRLDIDKECWSMQFRISNSAATQPFTFYGMVLYLEGVARSEYFGGQ